MKQTVFFSHSSLDSTRIIPIKDHILKMTGNAIQIFLSSDGASIPFGKNWLKEIEEALTRCKLMFIWITPNSLKSPWIYFESGYAYSRGIHVIPVGFDGTRLENVPAPLNILQGFNINSAASLNNIMAVINSEFGLTFPNIFDDQFYGEVIPNVYAENSPELLQYVEGIRCSFYHSIKHNNNTSTLKSNWILVFEEVLERKGQKFTRNVGRFYGVGFKISPNHDTAYPYPEIVIDPLALNNVWNIIVELNREAYDKEPETTVLAMNLRPSYKLPEDHYFISSRLLNTEVDFNTVQPHLLYRFRNILFRINTGEEHKLGTRPFKYKELILIVDRNNKEPIPVLSLIKLLIDQQIIKKE